MQKLVLIIGLILLAGCANTKLGDNKYDTIDIELRYGYRSAKDAAKDCSLLKNYSKTTCVGHKCLCQIKLEDPIYIPKT